MKILAIETSCDETGIALLDASGGLKNPRFKILKSLVASQIKIHRPFGGVVPNLAKREHIKNLPILYRKIFGGARGEQKGVGKKQKIKIDLITVTIGPGLEPALWTGIEFAKKLQKSLATDCSSPAPRLIGANHLEGHLYSFLLPSRSLPTRFSPLAPIFPAVALIVSGGHTILLRLDSFSKWERLGETRDDAAGEAFDKVARLLDLPYPGGPEIEKLAARGNPFAITFPRPMLDQKNYDFSFSGLKTAVLYFIRDEGRVVSRKDGRNNSLATSYSPLTPADIAASFQQAAIDVLVAKTRRAAEACAAESILLSGGVAANKALRRALKRTAGLIGAQFFVPDFKYNQDNAAMIGAAGYMAWLRKKKYKLVADGTLDI
jgi:N6-L-threonylcarbamoyladenine synthase